jgi:mRNA interferase YafQ
MKTTKTEVVWTSTFKKNYHRAKKQGKDLGKLLYIISLLSEHKPLPARVHDHQLTGQFSNYRELHIEPDWLLRYRWQDQRLILVLAALGSHSEMFR